MRYKILVVDDEFELRCLLTEILEQAGFEVVLAGNCRQAEKMCRESRPDAVILDVMLPDGDGFSLFGKLREIREIPVLILSARDEDAARLQGLGLGADDYITKPFLPQELCLRLSGVLRRVYGEKNREETVRLGKTTIHWGDRYGREQQGFLYSNRKRIRPVKKAVAEPWKYCDHRFPLLCPMGRGFNRLRKHVDGSCSASAGKN